MKTVRFYVQTAVNLQRKSLCPPECKNLGNMLIDFIWLNIQTKYVLQTMLYYLEWDMALWKWAIGLQYMQRIWWQTLVKQYTGWTYYDCRFSPTTSWMNNICANKEKCHTLDLYPAINLWSALEYSVYCTIIRIFQSVAACFLLTEYSFQFQVWLIAYFNRTKLHLVVMEKALLVDVVFDMQHAKV